MKRITAKFTSKCAKTGQTIRKGEEMYYDYSAKKCYSIDGMAAIHDDKTANNERDDANYMQAQEDAYFDNFCHNNNI